MVSTAAYCSHNAKQLLALDTWNIKAGNVSADSSELFDWRNDDRFKFQSAAGIYSTTFAINKENSRQYLLDLGQVYFTASVKLNGIAIGKAIWSPYVFNITGAMRSGENKLEVTVVPTNRNAFISEAAKAIHCISNSKEKKML